jgi:hypothetical protein
MSITSLTYVSKLTEEEKCKQEPLSEMVTLFFEDPHLTSRITRQKKMRANPDKK